MKRLARDLGSLDKPHPSRDHQTEPPNLAFGGQVIREGCQNAGRQFLRSVTCDLRSQVHDGRITVTVAQIITIGGYIDPRGTSTEGQISTSQRLVIYCDKTASLIAARTVDLLRKLPKIARAV